MIIRSSSNVPSDLKRAYELGCSFYILKQVGFGGLHDLFVPIMTGSSCDAALAAGPFLVNEPTPSWIVRQWLAVRGNAPDRTDPELATYVRAMLGLSRFGLQKKLRRLAGGDAGDAEDAEDAEAAKDHHHD